MKSRTVISQKIERGQYLCHLIDRTMVNGQNKIFACETKQAMLIEVVSFRPILASPGVTFLKDIYIAGLLNSWLLWTIIRRILYSWFLMYSTLSPGQLCFCFRRLDEAFKWSISKLALALSKKSRFFKSIKKRHCRRQMKLLVDPLLVIFLLNFASGKSDVF